MTEKVFDTQYADQYDLLYGDKDYEAECDLLEKVFRQFSATPVKTVLDLGCGTGNHAIPLAQRGYQVTGVDLSSDMLARAREKTRGLFRESVSNVVEPAFYHANLRDFKIEKTYDAVLMMFAVLGYQLENEQVAEALHTVHKHLNPGGLFIFDVWYGPAVLAIRPSDRIKVIPAKDGQVLRAASGSLDTFHHLAEVRYHLWRIQGNQMVSETSERHQMRYFFPQELSYFLSQAGIHLERLTAFPTLDQTASEESWNVLGIAKS